MVSVLAIVSPENEDSVRLLGKLGFAFERRATPPGDDHEVCIFGRTLAPGESED